MLINCNVRGCMQASEAKLNRSTNEVICEACGNAIEGVTPYMKKSLEAVGQVARNISKRPFQALCQKCNSMKDLYIKENKAFCAVCSTQVHVSAAFLNGLKTYLDNKE